MRAQLKIIGMLVITVCLLFTCRAWSQVTCPSGTVLDTLDWSDAWDASFNGTTGPHTLTSDLGIDVIFEMRAEGTGCADTDFTSRNYPRLSGADLQSFPNWPNRNCAARISLDFSSTGSPVSVFEAELTARDVDGGTNFAFHDAVIFDGASSVGVGSGMTPIPDGGQGNNVNCSNANVACHATGNWDGPVTGVEILHDTGPGGNANPSPQSVVFSDVQFCIPDTVPVSLVRFASRRFGNVLKLNWKTSSESFNAGFVLWGSVNGEWQAISDDLIRSKSTNSVRSRRYKAQVDISALPDELSQVAISSVDTGGIEEFYGPFEIGERYGMETIPEAIEWQGYADSYRQKLLDQGYVSEAERWYQSQKSGDLRGIVSMALNPNTLYRLSGRAIRENGVDLTGVALDQIAVTHKGQAVTRKVVDADSDGIFDDKTQVVFYAGALSDEDALYDEKLIYQLLRAPNLVSVMPKVGKPRRAADEELMDWHQYQVAEDNEYFIGALSGDPWVMDRLISFGRAVEQDYSIQVEQQIIGEKARLVVDLSAVSDLQPQTEEAVGKDEHRVVISVNGNVVIDTTTDGQRHWLVEADFDASLLVQGNNVVTVTAPGVPGYLFDFIVVESVSIRVPQAVPTDNDVVQFTASVTENGFFIPRETPRRHGLQAFAYDERGNIAEVKLRRKSRAQQRGVVVAGIESHSEFTSYWISQLNDIKEVNELWSVPNVDLQVKENADYVIIADTTMQSELEAFIEHRQQSGFEVASYTTQDIFNRYGYGYRSPLAIKDFLHHLARNSAASHVLLVGGHTFDYLNKSGLAIPPVNLLPTFYRATSGSNLFTPTDLPFVDFDNDHKPDLAIGRWPVRGSEELQTIIAKTIAYEQPSGGANSTVALLIAEKKGTGIEDYRGQVERLSTLLGSSDGAGQISLWSDISQVYVDNYDPEQYASTVELNQAAQNDIVAHLNRQPMSYTVFAGHGSPTMWGNQRLFTTESIARLTNSPTNILTLACYTTYYESLSEENLANRFLFQETGGAVMINGAALLGSIFANEKMAKAIIEHTLHQGATMGVAVQKAKASIVEEFPLLKDVVINWATLGDPALKVNSF